MSEQQQNGTKVYPDKYYVLQGGAIIAIAELLGELPRRHNAWAERVESILSSAREVPQRPVEPEPTPANPFLNGQPAR